MQILRVENAQNNNSISNSRNIFCVKYIRVYLIILFNS